MKKLIAKFRFVTILYKCIVVLGVVFAAALLASCNNVADGSSDVPVVGSVVMEDGTFFKNVLEVPNKYDAIAVVYKVDTVNRKAWAVGKVQDKLGWYTRYELNERDKKIDDLVTNISGSVGNYTFTGHTDGSTSWDLLANSGVTDLNDKDRYGRYRYLAWHYVKNYGTKYCSGTAYTTGWYFPTIKELYEIWQQRAVVNASLKAIRGSEFSNAYDSNYWSSSQDASNGRYAIQLHFKSGVYNASIKTLDDYVCAVRVFTF